MNSRKQKLLVEIGNYFLNKNDGDFQATERELLAMRITDVYENGDTVFVVLYRPGLLIGRKGSIIDGLSKHLDKKVKVIENDNESIYTWMIPRDWRLERL